MVPYTNLRYTQVTINMSATIQIANVTRRAIVVVVDVGIRDPSNVPCGFVFSSTMRYSGLNFLLQKSSSEQQAIAVGFKCGTKLPLHCIKPDSSGGRQPNVL